MWGVHAGGRPQAGQLVLRIVIWHTCGFCPSRRTWPCWCSWAGNAPCSLAATEITNTPGRVTSGDRSAKWWIVSSGGRLYQRRRSHRRSWSMCAGVVGPCRPVSATAPHRTYLAAVISGDQDIQDRATRAIRPPMSEPVLTTTSRRAGRATPHYRSGNISPFECFSN